MSWPFTDRGHPNPEKSTIIKPPFEISSLRKYGMTPTIIIKGLRKGKYLVYRCQ